MLIRHAILAAMAASAVAGAADAHAVFSEPRAIAGSHWAGAIRIGHGCKGGLATTAVRVEIPAGILVARPRPKPGWTVAIEREALPAPVVIDGKPVTERVRAVTWTGRLPDEQFDEFAIAAKLPSEAGQLVFPVIQTCEGGEARWTQTGPAEGPRPEFPAAVLTLDTSVEHRSH